MPKNTLPVIRVVSGYLLFGLAWIILSDRILERLAPNPEVFSLLQTYKGSLFVLAGSFLLYLLLHHELKKQTDEWMTHELERDALLQKLQQKTEELEQAYDATIEGWASALEMRSQEVEEHSRRVTAVSQLLGKEMGLDQEELAHLRRGALLHDIGKMRVPDAILLKKGPLTDEERSVIEQHPHWAGEMLAPIAFLHPSMVVPRFHHERWDGSGYPYGLSGEKIPLLARIFAVVDVWDALSTERTYHQAKGQDEVREFLKSQAGKAFDPRVVHAFLKLDLRPYLSDTYLSSGNEQPLV